METLLLDSSEKGLEIACNALKKGEIVGLPTETVYGLGADASNEKAVREIFSAKGRPADNPLIVHLADFVQAVSYTKSIPELAYRLAEKFCPGALTMVLPKNDRIPLVTSGGLDTVGIRVPSHPIMHRILELSGLPIAAPSANISGYPSPTSAQHVMRDMNGKIFAVVDGGQSEFGVESTVVSFEGENTVRILRPGCITREMLLEVCEEVIIDPAILNDIEEGRKVSSPGMKYRHYSPKAKVIAVEAVESDFMEFAESHSNKDTYFLVCSNKNNLPQNILSYGQESTKQAHLLFSRLREFDDIGAEKVYVQAPSKEGVGLAVYNRLIRASGFEVIKI